MSPCNSPGVRDRRSGETRETIRSAILPPYLRKTEAIEDLLQWLYLKGVSTGGFSEALAALLGPDAPGLSASTITRLKSIWEQEFATWQQRSPADRRYVYLWADGIYFNVRLEDTANARQRTLVLLGATADGKRELIAVTDGYRESEQSWRELLLDVRARGLTVDSALATGDVGPPQTGGSSNAGTRRERSFQDQQGNRGCRSGRSWFFLDRTQVGAVWMRPGCGSSPTHSHSFPQSFPAAPARSLAGPATGE